MTPTGPCFVSGPEGFFDLEASYSSRQTASLLGAIGGFFEKSTVYDSNGKRWQAKGIECAYKRNWWTVFLANTVYNPKVSVTVVWKEPKAYELEELKGVYARAVDKDDDSLTQFVEANELKKKISGARSFDDLVAVYEWMITEHDPED